MSYRITDSLDEEAIPPANLMITGVTGFLGAFLLRELLHETEANLYCLVRANSYEGGLQRIKDSLASYLLWRKDFTSRIIPVLGDLSRPLLGLKSEQFRALASHLDGVYHNGALVNFLYPYAQLKAVNVLGTQEVLRLACERKLKPVHYISTIGVFSGAGVFYEQDEPRVAGDGSGYSQSKWVAEELVRTAQQRGLPTTIYRPGRITGDSRTGVSNLEDFSSLYIKAGIELGSFPEGDRQIWVVPVDFASRAIVYLSKKKRTLGKVFHLVNPRPLAWSEIVNWLRSVGYRLETIPYSKWRAALEQHSTNPLYLMLPVLPQTRGGEPGHLPAGPSPAQGVVFDCRNMLEELNRASILCPPFDGDLLHTYWRYMIKNDFLKAA